MIASRLSVSQHLSFLYSKLFSRITHDPQRLLIIRKDFGKSSEETFFLEVVTLDFIPEIFYHDLWILKL